MTDLNPTLIFAIGFLCGSLYASVVTLVMWRRSDRVDEIMKQKHAPQWTVHTSGGQQEWPVDADIGRKLR